METQTDSSFKGLIKTQPSDLTVGMYVAQLDRDWQESNFPVQGFYIRNRTSIERVAQQCAFVYVDPRRYDSKLGQVKLHAVGAAAGGKSAAKLSARERLAPRNPIEYEDQLEIAEEIPTAVTSLEEAESIITECVVMLQSTGGFDIDAIEAAVSPLVHSVMRNKAALAALTRMRRMDNYMYSHAISCAVWGAVLARQLGLPPAEIDQVAVACSVMDLGKTTLPVELVNAPRDLSDKEWSLFQGHVERGIDLLVDSGMGDTRVINAVRSHHERFNGTGYPNGLAGNKIPAFGRIAGIVDTYDAMISERPYANVRSSYQACQAIQSASEDLFQPELVEYFVKAIGVFPVGSIVELNTGEVGVVAGESQQNRLRPKVMLLLDEDKRPRNHLVVIDLATQVEEGQPLSWWITRELPINAYGIDPQKYFLS